MEKQNATDALDRALTDLYRTDVPDGYRAAWRVAIAREEESRMKQTQTRRSLRRVALPVAAALLLVIGALSAGNLIPTVLNDSLSPAGAPYANQVSATSAPSDYVTEETASYEARSSLAMMAPAGGAQYDFAGSAQNDASEASGTDEAVSGEKIVRTADLTIATITFDDDIAAVSALVTQTGGYVASVNLYGEASERMDRLAYYSLRIPSGQLDTFLTGLEGIGRITSRSETATDKTTQYADTQMRLKTQQEKLSRLQALLSEAKDVSDLLEIENEIANTQYQLDQLESSLRTIDRDVDNSEVSLTVQEQSPVKTAQTVELTLWQRLGSGFEASLRGLAAFLQNVLVFLAMALPVLAVLAVLGLAIGLVVRARRRRLPPEPPAYGAEPPAAPAGPAEDAKTAEENPPTQQP